ncbi:MAG: cystathionine gamma-lyase, partial [Thermoplasmata archaeon]
PAQGEPFLPGPTFASKYFVEGEPSSSPYTYGRNGNPTWTRFEHALAELEGGPALVYASGMAAVNAVWAEVFLHTTGPRVLVLPSDGYNLARRVAREFYAALGVEVRIAPTADPKFSNLFEGATLVWLESPSNPMLDVCDLAQLTQEAHRRGALVAVDNTTATVLAQRPLELGADFSVASDSKALTGHSDLILGHVAVRDPERAARLRKGREEQGSIAGPMEVWLAHRSLATMDVRLERESANALAIAQFLKARSEVRFVRYPGLPDDPSYSIASRQMRRFGTIVSFELADRGTADRFLHACHLVLAATSFGGVHTTAERRGRWVEESLPEGFIRLSAGCESADDLIEDIGAALTTATETHR